MRGLFDHPLLIVVGGAVLLALWFRPSPTGWVPSGHRRTVCPRCDRVTLGRKRGPLQPPLVVVCRWCRAEEKQPPFDVMRRERCVVCGDEMWSHRHHPPGTTVRSDPLPVSPRPCPRCRRRVRLRWVSTPHAHDRTAGRP